MRGLNRGSLGRTPVPPAGAWRHPDGDEVEGTASAERPSDREVTRRPATVTSVEGSGEPPCSSTNTKTTKGLSGDRALRRSTRCGSEVVVLGVPDGAGVCSRLRRCEADRVALVQAGDLHRRREAGLAPRGRDAPAPDRRGRRVRVLQPQLLEVASDDDVGGDAGVLVARGVLARVVWRTSRPRLVSPPLGRRGGDVLDLGTCGSGVLCPSSSPLFVDPTAPEPAPVASFCSVLKLRRPTSVAGRCAAPSPGTRLGQSPHREEPPMTHAPSSARDRPFTAVLDLTQSSGLWVVASTSPTRYFVDVRGLVLRRHGVGSPRFPFDDEWVPLVRVRSYDPVTRESTANEIGCPRLLPHRPARGVS